LFRLRAVRGSAKPSRDGAELLQERVVVEVEVGEPGLQGEPAQAFAGFRFEGGKFLF
jgi:hypothetical protein